MSKAEIAKARRPAGTDLSPAAVWLRLQELAAQLTMQEPTLEANLKASVLDHADYDDGLANLVVTGLACREMDGSMLRSTARSVLENDPRIRADSVDDLVAFSTRDPACKNLLEPFLYYKGFKALQAYRFAHSLWSVGRKDMARMLQSLISDRYAMDIHPGASIKGGIFIDHGTGIVIGETAVIENDVSILHNVTLGGTGKETGDRHPKIRKGVLIGAGAKILGNIVVGEGSKVAAGSVVLKDVPPHTTVAGVPAKVVGKPKSDVPSLDMDHRLT